MTPALAATAEVFERVPTRKIAVAVSGGKDSLCTLDVCVRRYGAKNVTGFLMYLVRDLDVEWRHARRLEKRFGVRIVGVPHWDLSRLLKNCIYRPYVVGCERIKLLKQTDVEAYVRKETGAEWIAWGNRAADSVVRNAYLKRIRGVDTKHQRFYPIWTWKKADVYGYLHGRKLPVPGITGGKVQMGGVSLDPECLQWLRDNEPNDFRKILDVFPFAEAAVIKLELTQRGQEAPRQEEAGGERPRARARTGA